VDSFHKFRLLSWPERWLLVQALFLLPLTAVALRWPGFRRWQSALAGLARIDAAPAGSLVETAAQRGRVTAHLIRAAACHSPYRASCLQQSLVLWWLLRRQGIHSDLRIGVRKERGRIEAHAWVEHSGTVLNDVGKVHQYFLPFSCPITPAEARFQ
jgi:Transglutaminase-like superfamily